MPADATPEPHISEAPVREGGRGTLRVHNPHGNDQLIAVRERGREREDGFAEAEDKAGAAAVRGPVEETTGWRRMFIFREMRRMNAALMLYGSENVANAIFKLSLN